MPLSQVSINEFKATMMAFAVPYVHMSYVHIRQVRTIVCCRENGRGWGQAGGGGGGGVYLGVHTVLSEAALALPLDVVITGKLREAPVRTTRVLGISVMEKSLPTHD